ncbi:MAG: hypothetical protein H6700_10370 [Myxococcales bacterium]|nr:hypothetical protein [Myxococcales bacterium]
MSPHRALFALAAASLPLLLATDAQAQGLSIGADLGVTQFLDGGPTGLGANAYPGLRLGPLTAEAQVGYHRGSELIGPGGLTSTVVFAPFLAGGRVSLPLGLLHPWVGAHGGFAYVGRQTSVTGVASHTNVEWEPAYNVGLGLDIGLGPVRVGAGAWLHRVMDPDDPLSGASVGIELAIPLG